MSRVADGRTPIKMTPLDERLCREGRAPIKMTPPREERGRAPIDMTPIPERPKNSTPSGGEVAPAPTKPAQPKRPEE
jgi:hypothetical protein